MKKEIKSKKQTEQRSCIDKMPIGHYVPFENKRGKIRWEVKLADGSCFTCKYQTDAEIMSMLTRICDKLGIKD